MIRLTPTQFRSMKAKSRKAKRCPAKAPRTASTRARRQQSSRAHSALVRAACTRLNLIPGCGVHQLKQCAASPRTGAPKQFWGWVQGASDLVGAIDGRLLCLEAKTGRGEMSDDQCDFCEWVRSIGGFYATFGSIREALDAVERCRQGDEG